MFLAGFEIDFKILKKQTKPSLAIGITSFFVPFILVILLAQFLGFTMLQSIIFGVALSTSSLAIIFTILKEAEVLKTEQGQLILGAGMIVDFLSMLILGILLFDYNTMNLFLFVGVIVAILISKKFLVKFFDRYPKNRSEHELKTLLLIILAIDTLGELVGFHGALLAFILGALLSDIDSQHEVIIDRLSTVVFSLLAPIFFFHAGTLIKINTLSFEIIGFFLLFSAVSIIGKYYATRVSASILLPGDEQALPHGFGVLFNYRLSFGIVAALYAFEKQIITQAMVSMLLLCIIAGSFFSVIFQKKTEIFNRHPIPPAEPSKFATSTVSKSTESNSTN